MNRIRKIIKENENIEFVVHTKNKEELDTLISILHDMNFEYVIPLGTLREMADSFVEEDGYDGCWRISKIKGVAYNKSIDHWKQYCLDIIEIQSGELKVIEE